MVDKEKKNAKGLITILWEEYLLYEKENMKKKNPQLIL